MKGTLFSTDYVFDKNGNPRLIELNTDTGAVNKTFGTHLHCDGFINMLSSSNIDTVKIIYKAFQQNMVDWMVSQLTVSASFVTTIDEIEEEVYSIYPTNVADSGSHFILRMAYDENAILDSTYAKSKSNLHKLFTDYTSSNDTVEYYYSGSDGEYDTIDSASYINSEHEYSSSILMPDYVVKTKLEQQKDVVFTKVGLNTSSSLERYNAFKSQLNLGTHYFEKFHYQPSDLDEDNRDRKLTSIRSFDIIYGDDLTLLNIGRYKVDAYFDIPHANVLLNYESFYDNDRIRNDFGQHHKYELSTKFITSGNGLFGSEQLIGTGSNLFLSASEVPLSASLQSYYISGSDLTSGDYNFLTIEFDGKTMLSGSYVTSSIVDNIVTSSEEHILGEILLEGGHSVYGGLSKYIFSYDTGSDISSYKRVYDIVPDVDFLHSSNGTLHKVTEANMISLRTSEKLYTFVVENVDTMLLSGSNIIVHNAPCFIAGTLVHTGEGQRPIEDIVPGDKVITWNHDSDAAEWCEVIDTMVKEDERTVTYIFDNGTELTGTPDHPLYVVDKGYSSYYPNQTKEDSGLDVEQILIGDEVLHIDGYGVTITDIIENEETSTVYNLNNVEKNHNFFVENLLAHNRAPLAPPTCFAAGTEISLSNGDTKNIEDIVVGDIVLGWDGEKISEGEVIATDNTHTVESHWKACERLGDEPSLYTINDTGIEFTPEHPFLTKEGWKSLVPDLKQEPYKSDSPAQVLTIGDYINVNGEWEEVEKIKVVRSDATETVYNMTVDKLHSYIANGIIVHNK